MLEAVTTCWREAASRSPRLAISSDRLGHRWLLKRDCFTPGDSAACVRSCKTLAAPLGSRAPVCIGMEYSFCTGGVHVSRKCAHLLGTTYTLLHHHTSDKHRRRCMLMTTAHAGHGHSRITPESAMSHGHGYSILTHQSCTACQSLYSMSFINGMTSSCLLLAWSSMSDEPCSGHELS